jgi:hypothetical protein
LPCSLCELLLLCQCLLSSLLQAPALLLSSASRFCLKSLMLLYLRLTTRFFFLQPSFHFRPTTGLGLDPLPRFLFRLVQRFDLSLEPFNLGGSLLSPLCGLLSQ